MPAADGRAGPRLPLRVRSYEERALGDDRLGAAALDVGQEARRRLGDQATAVDEAVHELANRGHRVERRVVGLEPLAEEHRVRGLADHGLLTVVELARGEVLESPHDAAICIGAVRGHVRMIGRYGEYRRLATCQISGWHSWASGSWGARWRPTSRGPASSSPSGIAPPSGPPSSRTISAMPPRRARPPRPHRKRTS